MAKHNWLLGALIAVIITFQSTGIGQDLARIPYKSLVRMAHGERQDIAKKSFKLNISSTRGVPASEIQLILETKENPTFLIVDDKGDFEVPNTPALFEENPLLVANQPRGTLNVTFVLEVAPFKAPKVVNGTISYKELFQPVLDMQDQMRKVDPTFGLLGKDRFVLKFVTDRPIRIIRKMGDGEKAFSGARLFMPDSNGNIYMVMDAYKFKDNPTVEIPGKVEIQLVPVSATEAEVIEKSY